jgi:hypothetical protein
MTGPAPVAGQDRRQLLAALDKLARARRFAMLVFMAGESMSDREAKGAICTGADMVEKILLDVEAILRDGVEAKSAPPAAA